MTRALTRAGQQLEVLPQDLVKNVQQWLQETAEVGEEVRRFVEACQEERLEGQVRYRSVNHAINRRAKAGGEEYDGWSGVWQLEEKS